MNYKGINSLYKMDLLIGLKLLWFEEVDISKQIEQFQEYIEI